MMDVKDPSIVRACASGISIERYPLGFEEDDVLRSAFIRELTLDQLGAAEQHLHADEAGSSAAIVPRTLVQYWHDPSDLPDDVSTCLASWHRLRDEGFELRMFCDVSASAFIAERYGEVELQAFKRCRHPAMRSDYLRMCFVLAEGGLYVDADDVLLSDDWRRLVARGGLRVQPLCYDIPTGAMVSSADIWRADLPTDGRIFYVNNDPIAAPAGHPVLRRALSRATLKLLGDNQFPEIQSTTGPGNLSVALAGYARDCVAVGAACDVELLRAWDAIAETRWDLSYRGDARNWRNMHAFPGDAPEGGDE